MNAKQIRWTVLVIVGFALAALIMWLFAPKPIDVEISAPTVGPIDEMVMDQGSAHVREAFVVAAPVSGQLQRITLDVGDPIRAGQIIARIEPVASDPLDPRAAAQAGATVAAATAAVEAAAADRARLAAEAQRSKAELDRVTVLEARQVVTPQALENAQAAAQAAQAAVDAADAVALSRRADLARARAAMSDGGGSGGRVLTVAAPASGYVTRVIQESARTVSVGAPLVEIAADDGLEAEIEMLSEEAVRLKEGMAAEVYDWGGQAPIPAVVRRVEPQGFTKVSALGVEEQRVRVYLQFTGSPETRRGLGPGYRVWGRVFMRREAAALKIPLGALVRSDGGWAVYRIEGERVRLTPITVGALTDREAEVLTGISRDARIVVFPSDQVKDGVKVRSRT